MRAYKFLNPSGCSMFTGQKWPLPDESGPGAWLATDSVRPCRQGIHACRVEDLAFWLQEELWEIELADDIVVDRHKVVARRGRIVRHIDQWESAWPELAKMSAWRTRDLAVDALTSQDRTDLADRFRAAQDLAGLAALADDASQLGDQSPIGRAMALAADAGHFAAHGEPAQAPFVAAVAAGNAAARHAGNDNAFETGFAAERQHQARWISQKLDLR